MVNKYIYMHKSMLVRVLPTLMGSIVGVLNRWWRV